MIEGITITAVSMLLTALMVKLTHEYGGVCNVHSYSYWLSLVIVTVTNMFMFVFIVIGLWIVNDGKLIITVLGG